MRQDPNQLCSLIPDPDQNKEDAPVSRLLGEERAGGDRCASMRVHLHVRSRRYPPSCVK